MSFGYTYAYDPTPDDDDPEREVTKRNVRESMKMDAYRARHAPTATRLRATAARGRLIAARQENGRRPGVRIVPGPGPFGL